MIYRMFLLFLICCSYQLQAATYTVTTTTNSGVGSLREAITSANASAADDEIVFDASANGTITLSSALPTIIATSTGGKLIITGNGATSTMISGSNSVGVFNIAAGANMSLHGMTIKNGNAIGNGGGIYNGEGTVVLSNIVLTSNSATYSGGGVYNYGGVLTLINTILNSNSTAYGGGIYNDGTLNVINSTVGSNSATYGSEIYNGVYGTINLQNSIIVNRANLGDCYNLGVINIQNSLIEEGGCGITNGTNGNKIGDPNLDSNLKPNAGSPVIDAGNNSLIPIDITTDLAGGVRVENSTVDMGAYEFINLTNQSQIITFEPMTPISYGDAITFNATASSGLAVSYTSMTPSICSVTNTGVLTTITVGTCTIKTSQMGNANYNAASEVSKDIIINKRVIIAQADNKNKGVGMANPALTISYNGLANGDTAAVIDIPPMLTTTATDSSPIGDYPITCNNSSSSDNNYTINSCTDGSLSVTNTPITFNLTTSIAGNGKGTIQGTNAGQYTTGTVIQLAATAESGSIFKGWTPATCVNFVLTADTNCVATFELNTSGTTNTAPENYVTLADVIVTEGNTPLTLNLASYFRDLEDSALNYQVTSQDSSVVTTQVSNSNLTLAFIKVGTSLIRITAIDSQNAQVSAAFLVTVASKSAIPVQTEMPPCEPSENYEGLCNGKGTILAITKLNEKAVIANFIINKELENKGFITDSSILATGKVSGGKLSGTINSLGTIRDIEFVGKELSGGTIGGYVLNSSPVYGKVHDVKFEPCAFVEGGYWGGVLTGDEQNPVYLNNLTLSADTVLNNVILGNGVRITGSTQKWTNVKLVTEQTGKHYKWNGKTSVNSTACFAAVDNTVVLRPEIQHRGQTVDTLSLAIDKDNQHYSFNQSWLPIQPQIAEIKVAEQRTLPAVLTFSTTLFQSLPSNTVALFLGYRLANGEIVYSGQLK